MYNIKINHIMIIFSTFGTYKFKYIIVRLCSLIAAIFCFLLILCFFVPISSCTTIDQNSNEWPSFHGPDRTNKSTETGLLKEWPQNGPELLWTATGLGDGYSSISIGDGLIYTAGTTNNQSFVYSFDLRGKLIWKKPAAGSKLWGGSTAGPGR